MPGGTGRPSQRQRLRVDPAFRQELAFCNEHGIPHSEFLAWDPLDRAKALGFMAYEGEKCALCGTADWEWEEDKFAYEPVLHQCWGCYYKSVYYDSLGKPPAGATVELQKVTPQMQAQREVREMKEIQKRREAKAKAQAAKEG